MAGGGKIENIVSDDKYIIIYDWIHQYLKLNGNEAEAFALIYSFYQKEGFFGGSAGYISKRLYIPFRTGQRILEKLEKYKYITKEKGDYKTCNKYFINLDYISSLVPHLNIRQNVISADLEHTTKCRKGIRQNVVQVLNIVIKIVIIYILLIQKLKKKKRKNKRSQLLTKRLILRKILYVI